MQILNLGILILVAATAATPLVEDRFSSLDRWDLLDMNGDARISIAQDFTAPTGYGPSILAIEGDHIIGLLKNVRLETGTVVVLYRELDPRGKDADGLLVCHADYGESVSEEHNTKQVRPHVWFEQDNDAGLQIRSVDSDGTETLHEEVSGRGLVTLDWNETNWIWQKVRFDRGDLRAKYWPAHLPEPSEWAIEGEYVGPLGGRVGFRMGSSKIHIAYYAVADDDLSIEPPAYWIYPEFETVSDTMPLAFRLYTNGPTRSLSAQWLLAPDSELSATPQRLDIDAGPRMFTVGGRSDAAVRLNFPENSAATEIGLSLEDERGVTLAKSRVLRVDTSEQRQRIEIVAAGIPREGRTAYQDAALALVERARNALSASDYGSAGRSLEYAEELAGLDLPQPKANAKPFAPPIAAASVETRDGKILVNGEPFIVKGVNVHSLDASSKERSRKMLEILKARGFNLLRGDFPPRWQVDMAHEMGMAWSVLAPFSCCSTDDIFARHDGPPMTSALADTAKFINDYVDAPGVLFWNSCNEIGNDTADFLEAIYPMYRHLDPYQRPVHYANLFGQDRFEGQDIMGINYYYGKGQTPEDRQPIIQQSIDVARAHGLPIMFTEYNSYHGPIPETGVRAIYGLFQWGLEQGMSGGFFYMKNDSIDHPGVFDQNLETHPEMDTAFIDVFADARLDSVAMNSDGLVLRIANKREFTLREVRLSGTIGGTAIAEQALTDFSLEEVRVVAVKTESISNGAEFVGTLEFVTHRHFPCRVPIRGVVSED